MTDRREMTVEEKYSDCTMYRSEVNGKRIIVSECSQGFGSNRKYYVRVVDVDPTTGCAMDGETVATRCNYDQAMRIAREHYFK